MASVRKTSLNTASVFPWCQVNPPFTLQCRHGVVPQQRRDAGAVIFVLLGCKELISFILTVSCRAHIEILVLSYFLHILFF